MNFKDNLKIKKVYELVDRGKYQEILEYCDEILEICPVCAWFGRGVVLGEIGKYEKALEAYDTALEIDPNFSDALFQKSFVLEELGKYQEALNANDKLLKLDPNFFGAEFQRCSILLILRIIMRQWNVLKRPK